jgi:hypothetical protein
MQGKFIKGKWIQPDEINESIIKLKNDQALNELNELESNVIIDELIKTVEELAINIETLNEDNDQIIDIINKRLTFHTITITMLFAIIIILGFMIIL